MKLDPELQRRCMTDLGKWCSEKTEPGQELECLQDHLEDLVPDCREVVGNLTELESEVSAAPTAGVSYDTPWASSAKGHNRRIFLVMCKVHFEKFFN